MCKKKQIEIFDSEEEEEEGGVKNDLYMAKYKSFHLDHYKKNR
jgi:hypothetical protein